MNEHPVTTTGSSFIKAKNPEAELERGEPIKIPGRRSLDPGEPIRELRRRGLDSPNTRCSAHKVDFP